jgi:hypothetical protein
MTLLHLNNIVMVLVGTVIMSVAIRTGLQVRKSVPREFHDRWSVITLLMLFFFSAIADLWFFNCCGWTASSN